MSIPHFNEKLFCLLYDFISLRILFRSGETKANNILYELKYGNFFLQLHLKIQNTRYCIISTAILAGTVLYSTYSTAQYCGVGTLYSSMPVLKIEYCSAYDNISLFLSLFLKPPIAE